MGEELVLDAARIDYGHDVTLNRQQLALAPDERLAHGVSFSRWVERHRGIAAR
jgi:hypothetical protein